MKLSRLVILISLLFTLQLQGCTTTDKYYINKFAYELWCPEPGQPKVERNFGKVTIICRNIHKEKYGYANHYITIANNVKIDGFLYEGKPWGMERQYKYNTLTHSYDPTKVIDNETGQEWGGDYVSIPIYLEKIHPKLQKEAMHTSFVPMACGDIVELQDDPGTDGSLNYYDNKTGDLVMACGGLCMHGGGDGTDCSECPPKEWVCK